MCVRARVCTFTGKQERDHEVTRGGSESAKSSEYARRANGTSHIRS